jgi:pyruvate kinase
MATIGPASWDEKTLEGLFLAGVSSCRINFSHTSMVQAEKIIYNIRKVSKRINRPVAIRQDLQGPKIRIGQLMEESYELSLGSEIVFTRKDIKGDDHKASIIQPEFIEALIAGTVVVIGDNDIKLVVIEKMNPDEVRCKVTIPGTLRPKKGVGAPGTIIKFKGLTPKDINDFEFGLSQKVDCVSMSFVQTADDIDLLRAVMDEKDFHIPVISKIEQHNALEHIDEIIENSDGVSVARGDLAVERSIEELHLLTKEIIRRCNIAGKFVFAGSGVLSSLKHNKWPTRAEVCDVASLVLDGIDAISFSDETAVGDYPVGSIKILADIIARTEGAMLKNRAAPPDTNDFFRNIAPQFDFTFGTKPIIMEATGYEQAARIAKMRYSAPVIAAVKMDALANFLAHYWGLYPVYCPTHLSGDDLLDYAVQEAERIGIIREKEAVIRL